MSVIVIEQFKNRSSRPILCLELSVLIGQLERYSGHNLTRPWVKGRRKEGVIIVQGLFSSVLSTVAFLTSFFFGPFSVSVSVFSVLFLFCALCFGIFFLLLGSFGVFFLFRFHLPLRQHQNAARNNENNYNNNCE